MTHSSAILRYAEADRSVVAKTTNGRSGGRVDVARSYLGRQIAKMILVHIQRFTVSFLFFFNFSVCLLMYSLKYRAPPLELRGTGWQRPTSAERSTCCRAAGAVHSGHDVGLPLVSSQRKKAPG